MVSRQLRFGGCSLSHVAKKDFVLIDLKTPIARTTAVESRSTKIVQRRLPRRACYSKEGRVERLVTGTGISCM